MLLHLSADNYANHEHPDGLAWLAKHPRSVIRFTLASASWLNMVERVFRDISENPIKLDSFTSASDLDQAIAEYLELHDKNPNGSYALPPPMPSFAKVTRVEAAQAQTRG